MTTTAFDLRYRTQARTAAEAAYHDWRARSATATRHKIGIAGKLLPAETHDRLRVSDASVLIDILTGHILLARAYQADLDGRPDTARHLRELIDT